MFPVMIVHFGIATSIILCCCVCFDFFIQRPTCLHVCQIILPHVRCSMIVHMWRECFYLQPRQSYEQSNPLPHVGSRSSVASLTAPSPNGHLPNVQQGVGYVNFQDMESQPWYSGPVYRCPPRPYIYLSPRFPPAAVIVVLSLAFAECLSCCRR